ncbi:ArsO family NAD(P)H-dependent flavin-containing monooxygenase [Stutzerimonas stutzeri]|uniref:ArsO family NAD(P)H-dependent flavin-containing monooxygenase n=1 Tax=Stutzerimonas stutzeri TaxID=316 RepID=UPI00210B1B08|nr:ArsO family NAD(P)H-dependent flavin-containing monooxygenase [Stutzerimonas stutzeri]MCQ4260470.1 ArsO family NAD(P)H-dependent flavin-containing monooxygenase [Stutzerimonas stutzeri]
MTTDDAALSSPDVIVIGGGQSALVTAYFLRRTKRSYLILDDQEHAGGAWQHGWESLKLFSPAAWSSIAGWPMPSSHSATPTRQEVIDYLTRYEQRYQFPIVRPVHVSSVTANDRHFEVRAGERSWRCRALVSATGTWAQPYVPELPGRELFQGLQLHSAHYLDAAPFAGKRVLVIGGGNSGAQILAELSDVAQTTWVTEKEPAFLPDDVDGRVLFERATERWKAMQEGRTIEQPAGGIGDIVMVDTVKDARTRGVLNARRPFVRFTENGVEWDDGQLEAVDVVIWCTGFRPALGHLKGLGVIEPDGKVAVENGRSVKQPNLWLMGYGDWTGPASATLIGVTRYARNAVEQIDRMLSESSASTRQPNPN